MTSRDAILQRIRTELSRISPLERPPVPEVWPATCPAPGELAERFTANLQAVQGEVLCCSSMQHARQTLLELMDRCEWQTLGAMDRPICRELVAELPPERVNVAYDGWQPRQMAQLSAGLIEAERLLADTGTCLIDCGSTQDRLLCYLPPACVVIARVSQLAEHMPAAWDEIARQTAEPDRRGEFVLITGPSRTADIEKILILGVHGPKRLVVMLVD